MRTASTTGALVVLLAGLSFASSGCGRSTSGLASDGAAKADAPTIGGLGGSGVVATGGTGGDLPPPGVGGKHGTGGITVSGGAPGAGGMPATGGIAEIGGVTGLGGFCGGNCARCSIYQCYNCYCESGTGGYPGTGGKGSGGSSNGGAGGTSAVDAPGDVRVVKVGDPCWSRSDCPISMQCLAPGEFAGCGACRDSANQCSNDSDCVPDGGVATGKRICAAAPSSDCYCQNPLICQTGCRINSDCPSGQACNAQHTCVKSCTPGDSTCGANAECVSQGYCQQTTCTSNAECSGACVKGRCYSTSGTCQPLAA